MTNIGNTSNRTRTINHNGEQEQDQNQQHQEQQNNYNNYYYPARARACAREADGEQGASDTLPPAEIMQKIAEAYRDNISPRITKVAAGVIERALTHGMEPATVILAIEETGMAASPSPYYLSAVLRNWAENGVVLSRSRGFAEVDTTRARKWWS